MSNLRIKYYQRFQKINLKKMCLNNMIKLFKLIVQWLFCPVVF